MRKKTAKKRAAKIRTCEITTNCNGSCKTCGGCAYFLGFLGAAIYYIGQAATFGMGVLGFLKALVWPVFLVLEVLKFVGA